MNLHLLPDDKFSDIAVKQFEYYYSGKNIFVSCPNKGMSDFEFIHSDLVFCIEFDRSDFCDALSKVVPLSSIDNVFVHYLDEPKTNIACELVKKTNARFFWVFYGGDLYSILYKRKGYRIYDDVRFRDIVYVVYWRLKAWVNKLRKKDYFENFVKICDYVCYWDKYDFELLKKNYNTKAKFRFFAYYIPEKQKENNTIASLPSKQNNLVLIGNNSSRNGNELTILKKLKDIDKNCQLSLILPMSYGYPSDKERIKAYLEKNFEGRYTILDQYIPFNDYVKMIARANCAIFGQRRQAAGGNIFSMIKYGSKVFLREDNNVLDLLRDMGCVAFSFESDLHTIADVITPLSVEEVRINEECCILNHLSEIADSFMNELIKE